MMGKASAKKMAAMRAVADRSPYAGRRHATLDRLAEACDAIDDGTAIKLLQREGRHWAAGAPMAINPTIIEDYVNARGRTDRSWTGPKRVTIERDPDLDDYVACRRSEQARVPAKRPSDLRKATEDILSSIPLPENAQFLRERIVDGDLARQELNLVVAGMKKLNVDFDSLMRGRPQPAARSMLSDEHQQLLRAFVDRVTDEREMALMGMEIDGACVKQVGGLGGILIFPQELTLLMALAVREERNDRDDG